MYFYSAWESFNTTTTENIVNIVVGDAKININIQFIHLCNLPVMTLITLCFFGAQYSYGINSRCVGATSVRNFEYYNYKL